MSKLTIVIASLDPDVQSVWACLRDEGISSQLASCYEEAAELSSAADQSLLVLDTELPDEDVSALHEQLHGERRPVLWVLRREDADSPLGRCDSYIEERTIKPVSGLELALRIKALALRAGYHLDYAPRPVEGVSPAAQSEQSGTLIAVYGAKGGVGKSTLSVNLAVCLATAFRRRVLLADTDLWYGDVGVLLDARSDKSLFDICANQEIDLFGLPKAVVPHPLGPGLLLRPHDPRQVEKLNPALIASTLGTYRALYDYVIADTGPTLDEVNLHVLDAAQRILLVTTPELTSIHNCVRFLGVAEALGYTDKIQLVLNRANSGVDAAAIEATMRMKIVGRLVSDGKLVVQAANEGTSIFALDPNETAQITKDLAALAERVVGQPRPAQPEVQQAKRPSPLQFWRRLPRLRAA